MKVIVAHPGQQHSYQTATALKKNGFLYKYITTVYNKNKSVTRSICYILRGNLKRRALNRRCEELDDIDIIQFCELAGIILLVLQRIDKKGFIYSKWAAHITKKFGVKLAKYAIKHKVDAIIVYDTQGLYTGRYLRKKNSNIKLIMDVSAANLEYMREIYKKDMEICPEFREKMIAERGYLWDEKIMNWYREELLYPDSFLVASQFVKKSLVSKGIQQKIFICPYGTYFNARNLKNINRLGNSNLLRLVYVGNTYALKGIWYLFEAVMRFSPTEVALTVVGSIDNKEGYFNKYINRINFVGSVPHQDVKKYLASADAFIMPSLGDGMNLSTLEAWGMGLPCLVSQNTGACEYIVEGKNGYTFKIQNVDEIVKCIQKMKDNMSDIDRMKRCSLETADKLSWNNYYLKVQTAVTETVNER